MFIPRRVFARFVGFAIVTSMAASGCLPMPNPNQGRDVVSEDAGPIVSPDNDASDAIVDDQPTFDVPPMSGRTSCLITPTGLSSASHCNEYAYQHATEIPVRQNECNRLANGGTNTVSFSANTQCPRTGSSGCCVNSTNTVTLCYYPPIYDTNLTMQLCSGDFHYVAP